MSERISVAACRRAAQLQELPELLALVEAVEAARRRSQAMNQCALCGGSPYHRASTHASTCALARFVFGEVPA